MDVFLYYHYASDLEQEIYGLFHKLEFNTNLYRLPLLNQEIILGPAERLRCCFFVQIVDRPLKSVGYFAERLCFGCLAGF